MSHKSIPDQPTVTFGSYVKPGTVKEEYVDEENQPDRWPLMEPTFFAADGGQLRQPSASQNAGTLRVDSLFLTTSLVVVLTFLLGVLTTLYIAGPRDVQMTAVVGTQQNAQLPTTEEAEQPTPVLLQQAVEASLDQEVTRQVSADLISTTSGAAAAKPADQDMQAAILQGLTPVRTVGNLTQEEKASSVAEAISIISRNKLRMLREGVLANVYSIETVNEGGRKRIVLRTINADMTSRSMANLLKQAAAEGKIELPEALSTADGDVDMDTLIFNLVHTSLANDGTEVGAAAARELSRRAFAASNATTQEINGERTYLVQAGDSLAYISLQFYGRPNAYDRIFQANQPLLTSPDEIQTGQRLIIPS